MDTLDSLMHQLRSSVNRGDYAMMLYYHLGRVQGFIYSLDPSDKTMSYRHEALFLVNEYARRNAQ